jgi:hypothetical protein
MYRVYVYARITGIALNASPRLTSMTRPTYEGANRLLDDLMATGAFTGGDIEKFIPGLPDPDEQGEPCGAWCLANHDAEAEELAEAARDRMNRYHSEQEQRYGCI